MEVQAILDLKTLPGGCQTEAVLRLAPPRMLGRVIGGWHIAGAIGYVLARQVGASWLAVSPECAL